LVEGHLIESYAVNTSNETNLLGGRGEEEKNLALNQNYLGKRKKILEKKNEKREESKDTAKFLNRESDWTPVVEYSKGEMARPSIKY